MVDRLGLPATPRNLLTYGWAIGLTVGVTLGVILAFARAAWGSYVVTRWWLALTSRHPLPSMDFLVDAYRHHEVLNQVGSRFQVPAPGSSRLPRAPGGRARQVIRSIVSCT